MLVQKRKAKHNNERGMATFETIPLIVVFVMLEGYALGLFGVIHTATLSSIGARAYAFETFRNRTDLSYFRDSVQLSSVNFHYDHIQYRLHAVSNDDGNNFYAPRRPITFGKTPTNTNLNNLNVDNPHVHYEQLFTMQPRNKTIDVSQAWIMVGYGICMNPACGAPEP